jgi:hypothetical protein
VRADRGRRPAGDVARALHLDRRRVRSARAAAGGRIGFPSFRVRNRRAREALAWAPRYADYRSGLVR